MENESGPRRWYHVAWDVACAVGFVLCVVCEIAFQVMLTMMVVDYAKDKFSDDRPAT